MTSGKLTLNHYICGGVLIVGTMSSDTRYAVLPSADVEQEEYIPDRPKRSRFRTTWVIIGAQNLVIIILALLLYIRSNERAHSSAAVFPQMLYCKLFLLPPDPQAHKLL